MSYTVEIKRKTYLHNIQSILTSAQEISAGEFDKKHNILGLYGKVIFSFKEQQHAIAFKLMWQD